MPYTTKRMTRATIQKRLDVLQAKEDKAWRVAVDAIKAAGRPFEESGVSLWGQIEANADLAECGKALAVEAELSALRRAIYVETGTNGFLLPSGLVLPKGY